VILTLANLVGFLGFLLAGIVSLVLLRASGSRATGAVLTTPIRSLVYGLIAVVVAPIAAVILAATLVGIPLAILVVLTIVAAFVVGPVPAVAALGNRVLVRRGGLLGAFVVGAILWRFGIWAIPVVGGVLYIVALVWGVGAWIVGFVDTRRDVDIPLALLPANMMAPGSVPDDWTPPFAPGFAKEEPTGDTEDSPSASEDDEPPAGDAADDGDDNESPFAVPLDSEEVSDEGTPESTSTSEPMSNTAESEDTGSTSEVAESDPADGENVTPEADGTNEREPVETPEEEAARRRAEFEALLGESATNAAADPMQNEEPKSLEPDPGPSDDWGLPKRRSWSDEECVLSSTAR
jgi:hypothetical protein